MADIYEVPRGTLQNIPNVLRSIADDMEAGIFGKTQMGALVIEDEHGNIRTFGMGGADYYRAFAMFHLGLANLTAKRGVDYML